MYLRRYLGGGEIIVNPSVFDPDYIPEELPYRDDQISYIAREITYFIRMGIPTNLFLYGPPGTGKTATVKKLLQEVSVLSSNVTTVYVNAWKQRSRMSIMSSIATALGVAVPIKGVSVDAVIGSIEERLKDRRAIIVVDEADKLVRDSDVLYDLSRLGSNTMLITVANGREFLSLLDPRITSTLFQTDVEFPPYTVPQLAEILKKRAEAGLRPGSYTDEVLRACAAVGFSRGGDARIAIACLLEAAKLAESEGREEITLDDVRKVKERLVIEREGLPPHLALLVDVLKEKGPMTTTELYEAVRDRLNVTVRTIRNYINDLKDMGIVEVERASRRGNVHVIKLRNQ